MCKESSDEYQEVEYRVLERSATHYAVVSEEWFSSRTECDAYIEAQSKTDNSFHIELVRHEYIELSTIRK